MEEPGIEPATLVNHFNLNHIFLNVYIKLKIFKNMGSYLLIVLLATKTIRDWFSHCNKIQIKLLYTINLCVKEDMKNRIRSAIIFSRETTQIFQAGTLQKVYHECKITYQLSLSYTLIMVLHMCTLSSALTGYIH